MKRVIVEGQIAAGKSTLMDVLAEAYPDAKILKEPVEKWRDCHGVNALDLYYANPQRYSHAFQHIALMSRVEQLIDLGDFEGLVFSERSPESCMAVFASMLHDQKVYDDSEFKIYLSDYDIVSKFFKAPAVTLFIDVPVSVAHARLLGRGRPEEKTVSKGFLKRLDRKYRGWLNDLPNAVVLDGTRNFKDDLDERAVVVSWVKSGLASYGI